MAKKEKEPVDLGRLSLTRNIGIIAHIDAGKTTTTERVLYYARRTHSLGGVDEGTTVTDFEEDEQARGITIETAAVSCQWKPRIKGVEHIINILDTPGHVDFTAEVERSLRVLDGAVGVFCAVGGVEAQSETVWRQADRYHVPRIAYVNKLDRSGADFDNVVAEIERVLGARPIVVQRPVGLEKDFRGIVDLIAMRYYTWKDESLGADYQVSEIPADFREEAELYREGLIDQLADLSDEFAEKVLDELEITADDIRAVLRKSTLAGAVTPVLCGSSLRNKGVQLLLDAICDFLPSPLDCPPVVGKAPKRKKKASAETDDIEDWLDESRENNPSEPFSALVFKTVTDKHGTTFFFRVYSGMLEAGQMVLNLRGNKKERLSKLYVPFANRREPIEKAQAGDILATVGLRYTRTGDTLCDPNEPILLEKIHFPETVVSRAVEPKSTADQEKLLDVLRQVEQDDPTFRFAEDSETRQLVISGMGELHLEIIKGRIERKFGVEAKFRDLRVAYKQALAGLGHGEAKIDRELPNGKQQFAAVEVEVSRSPFGNLGKRVQIVWDIDPEHAMDSIPKAFWPAVEEGLHGAAEGSFSWGYPLIQIFVRVKNGEHDPGKSTAEAFVAAASQAFEKAVDAAGVDLLEPIMSVEVRTPDDRLGDVNNDLRRRGAEIHEQASLRGGFTVLRGRVPLASTFGYADEIRSLTNGRGSFAMEPASYEPVPPARRPKMM